LHNRPASTSVNTIGTVRVAWSKGAMIDHAS
jgi:hypothetical protein